MLKLSHKKRKACLALAVAAAILGANNAFAASEHDKAIYESNLYGESMRTYWQEQGVYDAAKHTYTFNEDISLKPKASEQTLNYWTPIFGGLYVAGYNPVTIDMQGHRLDIAQNVDQVKVGSVHNINAVSANGIHVTSSSLTINNVKGMDISVGGKFLSTGKVRGIYVAGTNQEGAYHDGKGLANLTINNADGWENAIKFKSSQAQVENAIEVKKNTGTADLSISGMVDLYVGNDSDVITISGGTSYYDIDSTPTAYIGGGAIKAARGRAALVSGGVLSINSKLKDGEITATAGNRDVQIEGNILVKNLQEDHGVLTLGMNTDKSYFQGTIFNENGSGDAYMLLQNGAQWNNASKGDHNYHGSSLKQFVGGGAAASTGYIYQKDSAALNLGNYSGYTTIFYEHSNAGTESSDYTAGNTIVNTAKEGSNITLITNNVDTNNTETVNAALNALAGKLYYNAAKRGDNALDGMAVIADGLTSSSKALKTAGIYFNEETGQGSTVASSQNTKTDFTTVLTGVKANDSEYADAGIIAEDGSYTFSKNSKIMTEGEALNSSNTNISILTKNDSTLSLASKGKGSVLASTLDVQNKGNVSITASELKVAMDGSEATAGITSGIQIGTMDTYLSRGNNVLKVKGDTTIDVIGKKAVMGIYSMTDSETVFDGNLKIKVNNTTADTDATGILGHYHTNGIYAGFNDSTVTVKGDVDITVNGTGIQANKGGKINVIGGGSVKIDKTDKADQYALEAEAAEVSMNVATDAEGNAIGAGNRKVVVEGNLGVLDKSYGAAPNNDGTSIINLGLATEDSSWRGVAYNEYRENSGRAEATQGSEEKDGKINLYLAKGAWTNESFGAVKERFTGSKLHILAGGASEAAAGSIFQNDSNKLTIDNYSGNTNIYYAHTGNGEAAENYAAGDTIIKHAEKDSVVSLITDNNGVSMDNADSVANVLNALAGKLTYSNFTNGEINLKGYVKIADGLTASSAAMKTGDITFSEAGKGTYVKKEIVEKSDFTTTLTGNKTKDTEYEGNISSNGAYTFSKDSVITITNPEDQSGAIAAGSDLTIKADKNLSLKVTGSNTDSFGLVQESGKKVVIDAKNLNIDVSNNKGRADAIHVYGSSNGTRSSLTINGNLNMKATHDKTAGIEGGYTLGAYVNHADVVINGNVTSAIDAGVGANAYYGASHLYVSGATGVQNEGYKGGTLTVNGNVDLSGTAQGLFANIGGAVLTVNGGGKIVLDKNGAKDAGYAAIRAEDSFVNMNVKLDEAGKATGGLGKDVVIEGNVASSVGAVNSIDTNGTMTRINLALDTEKSSLHGVVINGFDRIDGTTGIDTEADEGGSESKHFTGENNLWLQNGAEWNNEMYGKMKFFADDKYKAPFQGSHVTNFTGGSDAAHTGYIVQNDDNKLTFDKYSGYTTIFYAHNTNTDLEDLDEDDPQYTEDASKLDGSASWHYYGGDTIIKSAAAGSNITLVTDNANIDTANGEQVEKVLNALAGKLYYNAYVNNERNLAGTVSIADGLTASSFTKTYNSGDITFDNKTGQGSYVKAEAPVQTEFTTQIQGFAARDTEYVNAGITTGDQKYTFKKDSTITVGNKDAILGVAEIPADWVTTFEKTFKGVTVDAGENTLTLKTNQRAIYANGNSKPNITSNITAGKLLITANETKAYRDAAFAVATGGATLNINADIEGTVYGTNNASYGLYAEKGSKLTVNGDITAVKENGYGIDGKTVSKNYGIRVNDGTITVNGGVNMTVNGKAIAADKGTVNVNMNADLNGAADNTVILQGDVTASNGTVNLGLNTQSSKLTGAVSGNVNLYLANGASWDNTGAASSVAKLAGGTSKAGNIFANSTNAMTIENYSGNTNIFYAHTGNGEAASDYAAGDTIIKSAAEGSVVSMITDNTGVSMDNEYSVANVLNALAGKLTYSNFVNGEKNLTGYVKIADGLTASSKAMQTGNIAFNAQTGKGSLENGSMKPGFTYPETQKPEATEKNQGITGDAKTDYQYKKDGILKEDGKYVFTQDPTKIDVENGAAVEASTNDINIDTTKAKLELKGETGIKADGANVAVKGSTEISGNVGIDAVNGNVTLNGSTVINGTDAAINAGEGANVDINTNNSALNIKGDINANGGNITVDSGKATGTIESNVTASNGGNVEISLNDRNSTLTGAYNVDADSSIVMNIANSATWNLTDGDEAAGMSLLRMAKAPAKGLTINGGKTEAETGYLNMTKRTKALKIANYSGWETIIYGHENAGADVADYKSGDTIIDKAEKGSGVILSTDNSGINMKDKNAVEATLKALAQKVTYNDHEANGGNLTGKVQIADGLTSSSKAQNIGTMHWDKNGKGKYDLDSVNWSQIIEGDYETFVMKGVRSAATTSLHTWRDNMQDTYTGADLADEDGMFAKALGGKTSSDVKGLKDSNTYYGVQVGYDKAAANGWHTGVAFDYRNGDSNYLLGGKGDNQMYSLGVYGVKSFENDAFFRVAAKVGRVQNEYDVYNEIRSLKLHGDYKANAYGLTMEYGKTFGDEDTYFTPKAQLTWSQVGAKDYTAHTANAEMQINQDSYSSFVGRLGFEAGVKSEKGRVYAGLFAAHEFNGDISASYFANDGDRKHTSFDGEETWMEMKLGGTYDFSKNAHLYADFAKDFNGNFERKWKMNVGLRFEF